MQIQKMPFPSGKSKRQSGFSLIEILMVVGILAIVSAGSMAIFKNSLNASKAVDQKSKVMDLANELKMSWSKKEACTNNLFTVGSLPVNQFDASQLNSTKLSLNKLVISPTNTLQIGDALKSEPSVKLKSAYLGEIADMSSATNPKSLYMAKLFLKFEKSGESFGPRELRDLEIPMMLESTAAGNTVSLQSCYSGQNGQVTFADAALICASFGSDYSYDSAQNRCVSSTVTNLQQQSTTTQAEMTVLQNQMKELETRMAEISSKVAVLSSSSSSSSTGVAGGGACAPLMKPCGGIPSILIYVPGAANGAKPTNYTANSVLWPYSGGPLTARWGSSWLGGEYSITGGDLTCVDGQYKDTNFQCSMYSSANYGQ